MPTAGEYVAALVADIGYTENPPGSNRNRYSAALGRPAEPWCADFLVAKARQLGLKLPSESAYTPTMLNGFRKAGVAGSVPKHGAFAFFHIPGEAAGVDHVGCVEAWDDQVVVTIDGNTSSSSHSNGGQVARRTRPRSWVVGYGYPAYSETVKVPPMFDPPVRMAGIVADAFVASKGWYYQLDEHGWIHPWLGAPVGKATSGPTRTAAAPAQDGRVPAGTRWARLEADAGSYTCISTRGDRYGYAF